MSKTTKILAVTLTIALGVIAVLVILVTQKEPIVSELEEETQDVVTEQEYRDLCQNIEGTQTTVPEGMTLDSDGFCDLLSEAVTNVVYKNPESSQVQQNAVPQEEANDEEIMASDDAESEEEIVKDIEIDVIEKDSIYGGSGYDQIPAYVAYRLTNLSEETVYVSEISLKIDAKGFSRSDGYYSVGDSPEDKDPAYYLYRGTYINHAFSNTLELKAGTSKTIFVNVWNITGNTHPGSGQRLIYTLQSVSSPDPSVNFVFDESVRVVEIKH